MGYIVDHDQTTIQELSDLGLHCLLWSKYLDI